MTELGRLAVVVLCVAVVLYVAGHFIVTYWQPKEDRFVHTGGSENPYVMFDKKTAQACYAGPRPVGDFEVQSQAAASRATHDNISMAAPLSLAGYYFPLNKGGYTAPVLVELMRQSLEYKKEAAEERREADKLAELAKLPTCRSLL